MNFSLQHNIFASLACGLLITLIFSTDASAQELEVKVSVDRSQISSRSLDYLNSFAKNVQTYLNEHDWIDKHFQPRERILANMQITLLSVDDNNNFQAQLIVRAQRPIYNSIQETATLIFNDKHWDFQYTPNRALTHDEFEFDALTTVLDYYAYIILGYDFDTFSPQGGQSYFRKAQKFVSRAQTTSSTGWERTSGNQRNRAQLVHDLLDPNFQKLRQAIYQYHRKGLDEFVNHPKQARAQIMQALQKIQEDKRITSTNLLFDIFFNTKYRELVSVFKDAVTQIRLRAFNLLSDIDQSHLTEYRKLQD